MVRKTIATAICLTMAWTVGGCATKTKKPFSSVDAVFMTYDADRNGVITKEEFVSHWQDKQKADTAWKRIDAKNNGFVDRSLANEQPIELWNAVETDNLP